MNRNRIDRLEERIEGPRRIVTYVGNLEGGKATYEVDGQTLTTAQVRARHADQKDVKLFFVVFAWDDLPDEDLDEDLDDDDDEEEDLGDDEDLDDDNLA